ncbi:glycosyltransferase family 4 protein [candidate division WWE3 bacterium]|nr:glycosyltransferase family 4 protein [candidate division WWE3 bacterium]
MKIAVFIKRTTLHKGFGGLETQNKTLCEGLVAKGHDITVFSPSYELLQKEDLLNGVKYIFVPSLYAAQFGFSSWNKNNWVNRSFEVFNILHKKEKFDVVLGQSSAALGILRKVKIPTVSISHGTIIGEISTQLLNLRTFKDYLRIILDLGYATYNFFGRQREFVTHSKKIVAVSQFVKNCLIEETFIPENKVEVIYNGINLKALAPEIIDVSEKGDAVDDVHSFGIIYVGRLHPSKGLSDLLLAIKKLGNRNAEFKLKVRLNIVGDGEKSYVTSLKKLVHDLQLDSRVFFVGNVSLGKVYNFLKTSNVFVLPSRRKEGFPMTLVEAMFASLPIIGANVGGIPEAVSDGVTGLLFESGNIDKLSECIEKLFENRALCNTMSKEANVRAHSQFTLETMLDKYEKVLIEAMNGNKN